MSPGHGCDMARALITVGQGAAPDYQIKGERQLRQVARYRWGLLFSCEPFDYRHQLVHVIVTVLVSSQSVAHAAPDVVLQDDSC